MGSPRSAGTRIARLQPLNVNSLVLNPMMVHLDQGQVFLLIATARSAGNSLYPWFTIARVELTTNTYAVVGEIAGSQAFAIGATVGTYELVRNVQNSSYYDAVFNGYDFRSDTNVSTNMPVSPTTGGCSRPYYSADGLTYEAYCGDCRAHAMPATGMIPVINCAAPGSLVADSETQLYLTGRGVMAFTTRRSVHGQPRSPKGRRRSCRPRSTSTRRWPYPRSRSRQYR